MPISPVIARLFLLVRSALAGNASTYLQEFTSDRRRVLSTLVKHAVLCFALPFRQSSVYCFYDPEYRALALGKLTALKETEFVREVRFTA